MQMHLASVQYCAEISCLSWHGDLRSVPSQQRRLANSMDASLGSVRVDVELCARRGMHDPNDLHI